MKLSRRDGEGAKRRWRFTLYLAGQSRKSLQAYENLTRILNEILPERYLLEVVDAVENPQRALQDGIRVFPTLVRSLPAPMRIIVGDMSDSRLVLAGLEIHSRKR